MPTKKTGKKGTIKKELPKKICPICKKEKILTVNFYKTNSPMYSTDGRVPICTSCVKEASLNDDGTVNEKKLKIMCQRIDKPFYTDDLDSAFLQLRRENSYASDDDLAKEGYKILGLYFKNINSLPQNTHKSFADSEAEGFVHQKINSARAKQNEELLVNRYANMEIKANKTASIDLYKGKRSKVNDKYEREREEKAALKAQLAESHAEVKWTKKDKQNMKYVLSSIGYDPFEDVGLSDYDRKYCFNILAGYCDTDGVLEDGHKMQSVIEMAMLYCQIRKITEAMNFELSYTDIDDAKIAKLTSSKASLLSSISSIAKDNNISSQYNKNSKQGQNSLTQKMKEMQDNDFAEIEVNLFDIKTAEAFKQIDEISNTNIANQLTLDSNDYTEIVKEQREMIKDFQEQVDRLKEENRILQNELIDYKKKAEKK